MWKERTEKKKFEEGFAEEIKEIYALTQDDAGSCRMKGGTLLDSQYAAACPHRW